MLLKEGTVVYRHTWGCAGIVKERLSRYTWLVNLIALTSDGLKQSAVISTRSLKKKNILVFETQMPRNLHIKIGHRTLEIANAYDR